MSLTQSLHKIHLDSFADYNSGEISFSACWSQQKNILDKCQQILQEQIIQLESLTVPQEKLKSNTIEKEVEIEIQHEKNSSADKTWSIGILSNFIEKNGGGEGKKEHHRNLKDGEKTGKEAFKDVLRNLKSNNSRKKSKESLSYGHEDRLQQPVKFSFRCPECDFKSSIFWNLKVHLGTHIGSIFQCTICEEEHKRKFNLMEHIRQAHQDRRESSNRKWVDGYIVCHCESCDITGTVKEYDQHLHIQHNLPRPNTKHSGPFS